jgi:hypothetical protein
MNAHTFQVPIQAGSKMADVFNNSYLVLVILFVIYSVLKNMFRKVQAPPPRPVARPIPAPIPPAQSGQTRAGDIFKRELAKLFDLPIDTQAEVKEPERQAMVIPPARQIKPEPPKTKPPASQTPVQMKTIPGARKSIQKELATTIHDAQALRERVIWIEVMTPRALRRRWRAF